MKITGAGTTSTPISVIGRAALQGFLAWMIYAVVECAAAWGIPFATGTYSSVSPWAWRGMALLVVSYGCLGILLGAGSGVLLARRDAASLDRRAFRIAGTLSVVLGFIANLASTASLPRSEYLPLAVAAVVAVLLVAALRSPAWSQRTVILSDPWVASVVVLAGPCLIRALPRGGALPVKLAVVLGMSAVVGLLVSGGGRPSLRRVPALLRLASLLLAGSAMVLGSGWFSDVGVPVARAANPPLPNRPNVILIVLDTVRADHLSLYGYSRNTTPFLKELAQHASVYANAMAASDMTLSSHASIFTGMYPSWHGAYYAPPRFPYGRPLSHARTLADMLSANGYTTMAVVANYAYLRASLGLNRGFAVYRAETPALLSTPDRPFYTREMVRRLWRSAGYGSEFDMRTRRAEEINADAFQLLDRARSGGRPFFLFLNYMDAHGPYEPPAPYDRMFGGKWPQFTEEHYQAVNRQVLPGKRPLSGRERDHFVSQYDGGIAYLDAQIRSLITRVKELDLYEHSMIVITADHGEALGEHHRVGHAVLSLNQEQIHVPLLIKYPDQTEGGTIGSMVSHVDVMPTVLDALGLRIPAGLQGHSLLHAAAGSSGYVLSEAFPKTGLARGSPRFRGVKRAIIASPYKLITWTAGAAELYDEAADPGERHNLYGKENREAAALERSLASWVGAIPKAERVFGKLDGRTLNSLKSLGYVQ